LNSDPAGTVRFQQLLASFQAEPPQQRKPRWQGLFDRLAGPRGDKLVLFGSGQLGQWVLGRLRKVGIEPLCFSDNNQQRWGSRVSGVEVLRPEDAIRRFGQTACFVVTIYNGSAARKQLREMGCGCVLPIAPLFWKHGSEFMPELGLDSPEPVAEQQDQIRQCFAVLADDASRQEFCDQLEWRYWMKPEYLPLPSNIGEMYFPDDLVKDSADEVFVDCGAYDGDSIRSFVRRGRSFRHAYALEPDTANLDKLHVSMASFPDGVRQKITALPYAAGDKDEEIRFVEGLEVSSKVSSSNEGTAVQSRRLDSLAWEHQPTFIKMDIEGWEPHALAGATQLLKREMPVLAICLYHRSEHLWQIPNQIHSIAPGYSLHIRRYAEDNWEIVCYAVPPRRTPAA